MSEDWRKLGEGWREVTLCCGPHEDAWTALWDVADCALRLVDEPDGGLRGALKQWEEATDE